MSLDEKTNVQPPAEHVHEDFLPPCDWDRQKDSDTLILMLPGFRKEQLKVQVSSDRVLRLSGERKITENKLRRFRKEAPLDDYHDTSGISAKFEAGMLYIKLPKVIRPQPPTQQEPSKPQSPPPTQQEPSKPQSPPPTKQETKTDQKPDAPPQHVDEKLTKEDKSEESKTEAQTPKADHEDSQNMSQENISKPETQEGKSKTSETQEMHETTRQTTIKEEKEDHEDSLKKAPSLKEKSKAEIEGNEMREAISSEAQGTSPPPYSFSKSSGANMNKCLEMISDLVLEVKKQNKMVHVMVLVIVVLLIGLYIKSVAKSSFGGPTNQEL